MICQLYNTLVCWTDIESLVFTMSLPTHIFLITLIIKAGILLLQWNVGNMSNHFHISCSAMSKVQLNPLNFWFIEWSCTLNLSTEKPYSKNHPKNKCDSSSTFRLLKLGQLNYQLRCKKNIIDFQQPFQFFFFFYLGFLSGTFTNHRTLGEGGGLLTTASTRFTDT